jgi:hypothetical protein
MRIPARPPRPSSRLRSAAGRCACFLALVILPAVVRAQAAPPATALALIEETERTWRTRDLAAYLALWVPGEHDALEQESAAVGAFFASEQATLSVQRGLARNANLSVVLVQAHIFSITEPTAQIQSCTFTLVKRPAGWFIKTRRLQNTMDGLMHLSLDSQGYRMYHHTLKLPDFELAMESGTLFMPPATVGPTALVFVGRGRVRFGPTPPAEREQLRQYCGKTELNASVTRAFVRIAPEDFESVLEPRPLEPDAASPAVVREARRLYDRVAQSSYLFASNVPRSPWWVWPPIGDSLVEFDWKGRALLYTANSQPEGMSLSERKRMRRICLYPAPGRPRDHNEDDHRSVDILHHEIQARFDPQSMRWETTDKLRLRLLSDGATIRLRLAPSLVVRSVSSAEYGQHMFFRANKQSYLTISAGPLAQAGRDVELTVAYDGVLEPGGQAGEVLQLGFSRDQQSEDGTEWFTRDFIENAQIYANNVAWYPQSDVSDYATSRVQFDLPDGYQAISGGARANVDSDGGRNVVAYVQDRPGRYITAIFGRFLEAGGRADECARLSGYASNFTRSDVPELLEKSAEILRFYRGLFGPCPYPEMNLVYLEGATPGGHSPPGMVILSRRSLLLRRRLRSDPADFSDIPFFFLAHELAHQWWGHLLSGDNYRTRWMTEALAHYAAALWVREYHGEKTFRRALERMREWSLKHTAQGPIDLGLRLGQVKDDPQIYRALVYDKGAYVVHMLHRTLGDEAFRRGLREFLTAHAYSKAGTTDLRRAFEASAGRDLSAFFEQWIYGTACTELTYSARTTLQGNTYATEVKVDVRSLPAPAPLAVTLKLEGRNETRSVELLPEGGRWTFTSPSPPRKVLLNDDGGLLAVVHQR